MKYAGMILWVWATVLAGSGNVAAQVTAYPVKLLPASIRIDATNSVTNVAIGKHDIVGDDNLVLVIDEGNQVIQLDDVDASTNLVATLAESSRAALLADGTFQAVLTFSSLTVSNGTVNISGDGAALVRGQVVKNAATGRSRLVRADLHGVLNDSINGNTNQVNVIVRAILLPNGRSYDGSGL